MQENTDAVWTKQYSVMVIRQQHRRLGTREAQNTVRLRLERSVRKVCHLSKIRPRSPIVALMA